MKLTDISIRALKAPEIGYQIYNDDTVTGFGVRITASGVKSYVLTHGVRRQRDTIGRVGIITLQDARAEAKRRLAEYTLGKPAPRGRRPTQAAEGIGCGTKAIWLSAFAHPSPPRRREREPQEAATDLSRGGAAVAQTWRSQTGAWNKGAFGLHLPHENELAIGTVTSAVTRL